MATLTEIAEILAAVGGLLGGTAGVVTAVRRQASGDPSGDLPGSPSSPLPPALLPSPSSGDEDWTSTVHGVIALVIAAVAVLLTNRAGGVDDTPITVLRFAVTVPLIFAVYFGVRSLYVAVTQHRRGLLLSACSGLAAAAGAFVAVVLAGSPA